MNVVFLVLVIPPPLRKHLESQENDGHNGSWCLDKAVLARGAWYQKNICHQKETCPYLTLSTIVVTGH